MTTLEAMYAALDAVAETVADAATLTRDDFTLWPPATAPHGPNAARTVARQLADTGHHSHLHAHGETVCLTRGCPRTPNILQGVQ